MVKTLSTMVPLGSEAPDFRLPDVVSGSELSLGDLRSDVATVLMFICNHCPYVKHLQDGLVEVADEYIPRGVSFIAINSNDVQNYPDDSPGRMKEVAEEKGYSFPYLFDETQEVARVYAAACTPDFFVYDRDLKCVYRGQFDDSRPGNGKPVTGKDMRKALDSIIAGRAIKWDQVPSIGCNIKWK